MSSRLEEQEESGAGNTSKLVCPIGPDPGVYGKKWTLVILRGIQSGKFERFSELLKSNTGLSPRILSRRLRELEALGILSRTKSSKGLNEVRWKLTAKGREVLPKHPF